MLQEYLGNKNDSGYRIESVLDHTDRRVLSGSEDGSVYIWDLVEAKLVGKLDHNLDQVPIHSLSFHPDQSRLCTAAKDFVKYVGTLNNCSILSADKFMFFYELCI